MRRLHDDDDDDEDNNAARSKNVRLGFDCERGDSMEGDDCCC